LNDGKVVLQSAVKNPVAFIIIENSDCGFSLYSWVFSQLIGGFCHLRIFILYLYLNFKLKIHDCKKCIKLFFFFYSCYDCDETTTYQRMNEFMKNIKARDE
jgi:hypothetical protein